MPEKPANLKCFLLVEQKTPPTSFVGSTVECVLALRQDRMKNIDIEESYHITGAVAKVVGQVKLDEKQLDKQASTALKDGANKMMAMQSAANQPFYFDAESLFAPVLSETNATMLYSSWMTVKEEFEQERGRMIRFATVLPTYLPPSVRGKSIRIAYKMLIAIQVKTDSVSSTLQRLVQLPFRVVQSHFSSNSNGMNAESQSNGINDKKHLENPFWISDHPPPLSDQNRYQSGAYSFQSASTDPVPQSAMHVVVTASTVRDALSLATDAQFPNRLPIHGMKHSDQAMKRLIDHTVEPLYTPVDSLPASFIISCARGFVGRFRLLRTAFHMDDVIRGFLNFSKSQVPCLRCTISLQTVERYILSDCLREESVSEEVESLLISRSFIHEKDTEEDAQNTTQQCDRVTTVSQMDFTCINHELLPFNVPIPPDITPQFIVTDSSASEFAVDYRWRLHLEFALSKEASLENLVEPVESNSTLMGSSWTLPRSMKCERFSWTIPIQILSCNHPIPSHTQPLLVPLV